MTKGTDTINPCVESINHGGIIQLTTVEAGLSKREYFAAMAMQGILAGADTTNNNGIFVNDGYIHYDTVALDAVKISDALIEALNKNV